MPQTDRRTLPLAGFIRSSSALTLVAIGSTAEHNVRVVSRAADSYAKLTIKPTYPRGKQLSAGELTELLIGRILERGATKVSALGEYTGSLNYLCTARRT